MEYYMDEESKLSRHYNESSHGHYASTSSNKNSLIRSASTKCSATKSPLLRSFSHKNSNLSRSCSTKCTSSSSKSSLERSSSQKCSNFTRKCGSMAKEQKAKFYIVKRCITMLVFWHKHKHVDS
ncbi:hypothetical protein DCAR_0206695 [Daucus carota subsp. sativus]|uniref:Uncharacterized protein n=1 Tax=Daucus carota subsp. sativus TaxID=79200 RepID=A0A166DDA6_DAUCS|nr:hypothetical protein DCAR_0206695 [Daucus carota subsp. sativus]